MPLKRNLTESIDSFGIPLMEGEIKVSFLHQGKKALALFDISFEGKKYPGNSDYPPEYEDPTLAFEGAYLEETGEEIADSELDLDSLEDQAVEDYWLNKD